MKQKAPSLNEFDLSVSFDAELFEIPNSVEDIEEALVSLDQFLDEYAQNPEDEQDYVLIVQTLSQMGYLNRLSGDLDQAKECLEIALGIVQSKDLNPLNATIPWIRLADVLREEENYTLAAQVLNNIIEDTHRIPALEEFESAALMSLGKIYFSTQHFKDALKFFEKSKALRSSSRQLQSGSIEFVQFAIDRCQQIVNS